jgi:hypothetical protein
MKNRKILLPALFSIVLVFSLILPASVAGASVIMALPDDHSISYLMVDGHSLTSTMALNMPRGNVTPMVAAGCLHTVGLKSDGTVVAMGDNNDGQCNVGSWTDIIQVAAGCLHTVGLKSDGTVVAVGLSDDGQCGVGGWTDIIEVAAGPQHTVALETDHAVVAASWSAELAEWDLF